jgi:hypothetical protein
MIGVLTAIRDVPAASVGLLLSACKPKTVALKTTFSEQDGRRGCNVRVGAVVHDLDTRHPAAGR